MAAKIRDNPGRLKRDLGMRVLHIGKFFAPFAGGIENFMFDLLADCARRGVVQACLVHESPGGHSSHRPRFDFLAAIKRVPLVAQVSYAPLSPGFGRALERMIADFRPDLLHLHLPNTSAFWVLFHRPARQIPQVIHWHSDVVGPGLDFKLRALYPFYRPFEQALLKQAKAVIATSPPYLESSTALRRWRDKCRVVPLGIDPRRIRPNREQPDWPVPGGNRLKVLAIGRLSRYKGFETLIRAAATVENCDVIIAGDGPHRRRLQQAIPDVAQARIRLAGGVSDHQRNRLLAACDVLCLPSHNRAEAFGVVLLEAMAAGKPQIACRVAGSGMSWVIEDGKSGWLVPPGDAAALAALLHRLSCDPDRLRAGGRAAERRFTERFRIAAVAEAVVALYEEILNPGHESVSGSDGRSIYGS